MLLRDRCIFVTGAASGIGRASALAATGAGAAVALVDLAAPTATAEAIRDLGGKAVALAADIADEDAISGAVAEATREFGRIDGTVACAGIFGGRDFGRIEDVELDGFLEVLRVNLTGTFLTLKHTLPQLREHGGSAVLVASVAAIRGTPAGPGYTASKGGIDALTRLAAMQYGSDAVRVNAVLPGGTHTGMTAGFLQTEEARAHARATVPLQRHADAEEMASVITFLLSDGASHMTGQSLVVDGGWSIV